MKYLFFLFFINFQFSIAQQSWFETNIELTTSRYDDVFFLNESLGWAALGGGSKVFKTTDGGVTWQLQFEDPLNYFRNIEFLDENIGFLGTLNGSFYKTIDGGANWEAVFLPGNTEAICGMDAVNATTIYGCGAFFQPAYIIKSTDSGTTWTYIDMSDYATGLVEVLFTSELVGYASGKNNQGGVLLKTADGGETWEILYNTSIEGEYVWKLQILASNPNIMFGSVSSVFDLPGKLIKSTNSGQSWISKNVPDTDIQAVGFITENHGWMGGHNSGFLETFDSGTTWITTGFGFALNRFVFLENNVAYACGASIYKLDTTLATVNTSNQTYQPTSIKVNPNPIVDKLNIEIEYLFADNLLLEVYSSEGKLIKKLCKDSVSSKMKKNYTFDFDFPKGTYILNFVTNADHQSIKIIK
jgi:photosystem II stability/assembly factor-like uncharacterized protein